MRGWLCYRLWMLIPLRFHGSRIAMWLLPYAGAYAYGGKYLDRCMDACLTGKPMDMARASYGYSRAAGLTVWQAFTGALPLYFEYRRKAKDERGG